jgi:nucleotide-binding universal stress UspA family protein
MFQKILLAVDGSESSLHAADVAIELAALMQAELHLLSVEETLPRYVATHEESSTEHAAALSYYGNIQAPLRKLAEQRGVRVITAITSGHEGQMIVGYIQEQHCDLLVLGYQGYSSVWGAFLGGTADKVVSQAPCSVLVVPPRRQSIRHRAPARFRLSRRSGIMLALAGRFSLRLPEDLFRRRSSQGALTAQQIMRPHLFAVMPTAPIGEAIRTMLAHQIKRLVVVDEAGKPLGLVDRQQLLRSLIMEGATIDEMRVGEQELRAAAEDKTEE